MKICTECATEKPECDFWKAAGRKDGLQVYCKTCMKSRNAAWADKNREKTREYVNACAARNRDRRRESAAAAYYADIEKSRASGRARVARRKQGVAAYGRSRRANDVSYAIRGRISAQLRYCLASGKGGATTESLLGYAITELKIHLERQFLRGMSWGNMGEWHIDHIVPLSSFTITGADDPELRRAWSLPNLRPLWAADNIAKRDKRVTLL
jgi:hypothetical protein